jgi:hypothetical protein
MELHDGFKVITQEETPLFRAHAVLFDMGARNVLVSDYVQFERYACPAKLEDGRVVGSAHLYVSDSKVQVTIVLDYHSPERLDLDLRAPLYATAEGGCYLRGDLTMDYVDIAGVVLSSRPLSEYSVIVQKV